MTRLGFLRRGWNGKKQGNLRRTQDRCLAVGARGGPGVEDGLDIRRGHGVPFGFFEAADEALALGLHASHGQGVAGLLGLFHRGLQLGRAFLQVRHAPGRLIRGIAGGRIDHSPVGVLGGAIDTADRGDGLAGGVEELLGAFVVERRRSPGLAVPQTWRQR